MSGGVGMLGGVPVWRAIAAERTSALLAGSEMNPTVAGFYTLLAFQRAGMLDGIHGSYVWAAF